MLHKKLLLILIACSITGLAFTAYYTHISHAHTINRNLLMYNHGKNYKAEWARVDSLEKKGLTHSAIKEVEKIYAKAQADKMPAQIAKCIIYQIKFSSYIEEDSFVKSIYALQEEINKTAYPLKNVLYSIQAELYWQYYQQYMWQIHDRTQISDFKPDDIRTWDAATLTQAVAQAYEYSLAEKEALQRTPVALFDDILETANSTRKIRPFLYDFLAYRAFDFFSQEEARIGTPAHAFIPEHPVYFADASAFANHAFETSDTHSYMLKATLILQELTRFHSADKEPDAFLHVTASRLLFAMNKSAVADKDNLYLQALQKLEQAYVQFPASAEISYYIASHYNDLGNRYRPFESDTFRWHKKMALEICEQVLKKYPGYYGGHQCKALKTSIEQKSLKFDMEFSHPENTHPKVTLEYRNLKKVWCKIISIDWDTYYKSNEKKYNEDLMKYLNSFKPIKKWEVELPPADDYQLHVTEFATDSLPLGHYVLLISDDEAFSYKEHAIAYTPYWISNLAYLTQKVHDGKYMFLVTDKHSGKPLKDVQAQLYQEKYNYTLRKYEWKKLNKYTTNEKGIFYVESTEDYTTFYVDFSYRKDRLNTDNSYYQYKPYNEKYRNTRTIFFTDRSICRPGQTVFFKGIVLDVDDKTSSLKKKFTSHVTFYDVNHQVISEQTLLTNEYGSFSGSFTAPGSSINGSMYISDGHGSVYISVEEYKRPTFEVTFEPVSGVYKLNDTVLLKGKAATYAGSNLDNVEVQFRVTRNVHYPRWYYFYRWYAPPGKPAEIMHGKVSTDASGNFDIRFPALPDKTTDKKWSPAFSYSVTATVTDMNGETRENTTYVTVGYQALEIVASMPEKIDRSKPLSVPVYTSNLNGQPVSVKGKLKVWKLQDTEKVYRQRLSSRPDAHLLSKEEFYRLFPHDVYADELNRLEHPKEKLVFETDFVTDTGSKKNEVLFKDIEKWQQGDFVAEFTAQDPFGGEIKDVNYFTLYDTEGSESVGKSLWWLHELKTTCEPGEKAGILISSAAENVHVLVETEHNETKESTRHIVLNKSKQLLEFPVNENHRGGFVVHIAAVKYGRLFTHSVYIHVPYTNKQLDLSFSTFRNKLYPGQQEEWKITVKDKKGEKMAAELLASMYDASLDAFKPHNWYFDIYSAYYARHSWQSNKGFALAGSRLFHQNWNEHPYFYMQQFDRLNWFGFYVRSYYYRNRYPGSRGGLAMDAEGEVMEEVSLPSAAPKSSTLKKESAKSGDDMRDESPAEKQQNEDKSAGKDANKQAENSSSDAVSVRSNLNETAFFFPQLSTNEKGETQFSFTVPEALTRWKVMSFAHTQDLKYGFAFNETVTQKELMVFPNMPRFFRQGDNMTVSCKISNLSTELAAGTCELIFTNALNGENISKLFHTAQATQSFKAEKGNSALVSWEITVPDGISSVSCKVIAKAGKFSDGEERYFPVLTNRMLVTESMPLPIRGKGSKEFVFSKLAAADKSTTIKHHKLTLEFTSNPAWYAIQALPYMMEYPYECAEQTFSRYYANAIGAHVANSSPKVKAVFDSWKTASPETFLSNLQKNQELKSLLLEETPWVLDAKDESERKKRVALLFDFNNMANELSRAIKKLQDLQTSNGGWAWFKGMRDDRYITQHIVMGFGHLDRLGVKSVKDDHKVQTMLQDAVKYLDNRMREDFEQLKKHHKNYLKEDHLGYFQIQYLYARSFFLKDVEITSRNKEAIEYYRNQASQYWVNKSRYMQAMLALALHRWQTKQTPADIIKSLKENALYNEEMGMYWKENTGGYYWYQAPIETQALLIEAFDEVAGDKESVEAMKVWLLKNKQTNDWKTTKATAQACYALLLRGTDWLAQSTPVEIQIGGLKLEPEKMPDVKVEAGTGYFKTAWSGKEINSAMATVKLTKKDEGVAWGALYWQYFEDLDKITPHETPLKIKKQLFLQQLTDAGPVITSLEKAPALKPGDKLIVRIEIRVDRDMEYVHMKDMRASGLEPINVLSGYRYRNGLGYYETTKDAATNFFFDFLPKGTYVFEYPLRVNIPGNYSNGITSMQCMYAPEFTSHSEGLRMKIGKK